MTAFAHWSAMHAWWCARRTERDSIGKPWPPRAAKVESGEDTASTGLDSKSSTATPTSADAAPPPTPTVLDLAQQRMAADKARKIAGGGADSVTGSGRVISPKTADHSTSATSDPPPPPDEGAEVLASDVAALATRYDQLPDDAKTWTSNLIKAGRQTHEWRIKGIPTVRRYELYRGVLALAAAEYLDDDYIRAIIAAITNRYSPDKAAGALLGELDWEAATDFSTVAHDLITEKYNIIHTDNGQLRIQHVA